MPIPPRVRPCLLRGLTALALVTGCAREAPPPPAPAGAPTAKEANAESAALQVTSSAFSDGQPIPTKYTCDGENVSPPLKWTGVPAAAKSVALICDDPDAPAGTWVHWVAYGLPASATGLPEGVAPESALVGGGKQGTNDFKRIGYGGPGPPGGKAHHYHFKLYALDAEVDLPSTATKTILEKAMAGHVVATGELVGTYQRR